MKTTPRLFDMAGPDALTAASKANVPDAFPDWLKRRLIATGHMDEETGATRRARSRTCDQCRRPVMSGIDEEWGGQARYADHEPLSGMGEAFALMAGRATYELAYLGDRYELTRRNATRITGRPAGTPGIDVLVGHVCNDGGPLFEIAGTRIKDHSTVAAILPDKAPF